MDRSSSEVGTGVRGGTGAVTLSVWLTALALAARSGIGRPGISGLRGTIVTAQRDEQSLENGTSRFVLR